MMVVEIAAGIVFNSMALLADGWHMSTHVAICVPSQDTWQAAFAVSLLGLVRQTERTRRDLVLDVLAPLYAARTEVDFLCQVVEAAIAAGATTVNIPDTVGYATPLHYGRVNGERAAGESNHCNPFDFSRLHRFEPSGTLAGLTRVRSMAQDDAHQAAQAVIKLANQLEAARANFLRRTV